MDIKYYNSNKKDIGKVAFYLRISRNTVNGYVKFFNGLDQDSAGSYRLMMPIRTAISHLGYIDMRHSHQGLKRFEMAKTGCTLQKYQCTVVDMHIPK